MWKKHVDVNSTYEDFKKSYNKDVNLRSEIKNDIEKEYPNLFRRTRKAILFVKHISRNR